MPLPTLSPDTISAMAAIGGAVAVKLFEKFALPRTQDATQSSKDLIDVLRTELDVARVSLKGLNDGASLLREELAKWQTKYWKAKSELDSSEFKIAKLMTQIESLEHRIKELEDQIDPPSSDSN